MGFNYFENAIMKKVFRSNEVSSWPEDQAGAHPPYRLPLRSGRDRTHSLCIWPQPSGVPLAGIRSSVNRRL